MRTDRNSPDGGKKLSLLPATKLSSREVNLTVLMVAVASLHVLLTAPGNAEYLMWTAFPDTYVHLQYTTYYIQYRTYDT